MWQIAARIREFAVIRAMEMKIAAAAALRKSELATAAKVEEQAVQSSRLGESGNPCKLRLKIAQVHTGRHRII